MDEIFNIYMYLQFCRCVVECDQRMVAVMCQVRLSGIEAVLSLHTLERLISKMIIGATICLLHKSQTLDNLSNFITHICMFPRDCASLDSQSG
jgi:hypothetical protein